MYRNIKNKNIKKYLFYLTSLFQIHTVCKGSRTVGVFYLLRSNFKPGTATNSVSTFQEFRVQTLQTKKTGSTSGVEFSLLCKKTKVSSNNSLVIRSRQGLNFGFTGALLIIDSSRSLVPFSRSTSLISVFRSGVLHLRESLVIENTYQVQIRRLVT